MTDWLVDKSALVRLGQATNGQRWVDRVQRGLVRMSTVTRLEVGFSARTGEELRAGLRHPPLASMPSEYLTPAIGDQPEYRSDGEQSPDAVQMHQDRADTRSQPDDNEVAGQRLRADLGDVRLPGPGGDPQRQLASPNANTATTQISARTALTGARATKRRLRRHEAALHVAPPAVLGP